MLQYILRRAIGFLPLILAVSIIAFVLIELPPGDFLTTYIERLEEFTATKLSPAEVENLTRFYGLDRPFHVRYAKWIGNLVLRGNFGWSLTFNRPVNEIIREPMVTAIVLSLLSLLVTYLVAVPVGIVSAVRQYSWFDYTFTFLGFIGLAVPSFLLALVVLWFAFRYFGVAITGLFSPDFIDVPWSFARVADLLKRIWAPVIIVAVSGMAALIRVLRGSLLDELAKQYVVTARAKGMSEPRLLFRYPVRLAVNPIISGIGWVLPAIVSGETVTSIVLNLQTTGPILFHALLAQDMYLAGSIVLILSSLVLVGNLVSDILLAWIDPRIQFGGLAE